MESDRYDFDDVRVGIQPFISDFRGFLFQDQPVGIRFFGNRDNNQWQYNLGWFRRIEKDTNSGLNDIGKPLRDDDVFVANLYKQDFMIPGFTLQGTVDLQPQHETANEFLDNNGFQVRPAVLGDMRPHSYDVVYLGVERRRPLRRWNTTGSIYYAFGRDDAQSVLAAVGRHQRVLRRGGSVARLRLDPRARLARCTPPATTIRTTTRKPASTRSSRTRSSPAPTRASGSARRSR